MSSQGPLTLNIRFSLPFLDLACQLCESFLVESPIWYLACFKTILAALFKTPGLPLRFLPSKPHFSMIILPANIRTLPVFSAVSTTDKSVNRSIHAYALT